MNFRYLCKLSRNYIKFHKKLVLPFVMIMFFSSFMLTSTFVIKDSYDAYQVKLMEKMFGNWDVKCSPIRLNANEDVSKNLEILLYESSTSYHYEDLPASFKEVSAFNPALPITLVDGTYPKKISEVLIEDTFAKGDDYQVNDFITFTNENGDKKEFVVSGIFSKNIWFPTILFYTRMPNDAYDNAFSVYTKLKDPSNIDIFIKNAENNGIRMNMDLINVKYHGNQNFNKLYSIFIIFIFLCAFLFIYNTSTMYLKKKKSELYKLSTLGATKKQILALLAIEFFLISSIIFMISLLISLAFWYLLFTFGSPLLTQVFQLSLEFEYALSIKSLLMLLLLCLILFILCFITALFKNRKVKDRELHFRKICFNKLPIICKVAITDILRTGYGFIIIIMLVFVTIFFHITQYVVESWISQSEGLLAYDTDVNVNFELYGKNSEELSRIINKVDNICKEAKGSCTYRYGVQAEAKFKTEIVTDVYSVDDALYETLFDQKSGVLPIAILLVDENATEDLDENISIYIRNQWLEPLDTVELQNIQTKPRMVDNNLFPDNNTVLILPKQFTLDWVDKYSNTYIVGSININGNNSTNIARVLDSELMLGREDHLYILNNLENKEQFQRDANAIRILIYGFNLVSILVCVFVIQSLLSQYYESKKRDVYLLGISGMTKTQILKVYINQSMIYSIAAILFSSCIMIFACILINHYMDMNFSIFSFLKNYFLYCFVLLMVMSNVSLLTIRKYIKNK